MEKFKEWLPNQGSFYAKRLLPLFLIWIVLVLWRPFFFGFYHDDWYSVAMPLDNNALLANLQRDPTRPLYVIILFVMRSILKDHAFIWQMALSILHLLIGLCIAKVSTRLNGWLLNSNHEPISWSGVVAGILWLSFPWSLGYSAWPIMFPPLLSVLFALVAVIFVSKEEPELRDFVFSLCFFSLGWLIYEATWFIWFPVSLVLILREIYKKNNIKKRVYYFFIAGFLQLTFIVLNRYISSKVQFAKRVSKSITPTLITNINLFKTQLLTNLDFWIYPITFGVLSLVILAFYTSVLTKKARYLFLILFLLLVGVCLSTILYAFAGYAVEWTGLFSRVTMSLSFWFVLILSCLFGMSFGTANRWIKMTSILSVFLIVFPLAKILLKNSEPWKSSWLEQKEILAAIQQPVMNLAGDDSLILMDVPRGEVPIHTFSAFWDISGALVTKIKTLVRKKKNHTYASVLRRGEWRTTWDGNIVRQYWCTSPETVLWELDAKKLYLWTYPQVEATVVSAPYEAGCEILKTDN